MILIIMIEKKKKEILYYFNWQVIVINYKYMLYGDSSVYTFETTDKFVNISSNIGFNRVQFPVAYSKIIYII